MQSLVTTWATLAVLDTPLCGTHNMQCTDNLDLAASARDIASWKRIVRYLGIEMDDALVLSINPTCDGCPFLRSRRLDAAAIG